MLNQAAIFIAEDEPYIALALQWAVEDAGGTVIGPAATIVEALALLDVNPPDAAILDVIPSPLESDSTRGFPKRP